MGRKRKFDHTKSYKLSEGVKFTSISDCIPVVLKDDIIYKSNKYDKDYYLTKLDGNNFCLTGREGSIYLSIKEFLA